MHQTQKIYFIAESQFAYSEGCWVRREQQNTQETVTHGNSSDWGRRDGEIVARIRESWVYVRSALGMVVNKHHLMNERERGGDTQKEWCSQRKYIHDG